jgi:FAD/FMN-containing dehydrogenase
LPLIRYIMECVNPTMIDHFSQILGPRGMITDQELIAPWLLDWRDLYQGAAAAILLPDTTEQVAACVKLAAAQGIPLVPQGGNTSMVGGATPPQDGSAIILSLRRMNRVRSVDRQANEAVVEAGVILSAFHEASEAADRRFPLSLGAKGSATIGGLCATNAGGTQVLRFGNMRKLVLGLEAVLPDGSIFDGLVALKKETRGYDLSQLLVGSEGTLGIITAATLRLFPLPPDKATAWVGVSDPKAALRLLRFLEQKSGDAVESFELMPADSLALVEAHIVGARLPLSTLSPWHVLIDYTGVSATEQLEALCAAAMEQDFAIDATIAQNGAQADAFWKLRESISAAERANGPAVQHDISVRVDDMPTFLDEATAAVNVAFPGVSASGYGHLGDGNIHFHVRAPAGVDGAAWRKNQGKPITAMVYDLVTAMGGSISAEHGIGQMKIDEFARLSSPARLLALRSIKAGIDPQGLMNPGKLVPPFGKAQDRLAS